MYNYNYNYNEHSVKRVRGFAYLSFHRFDIQHMRHCMHIYAYKNLRFAIYIYIRFIISALCG